MNQYTPSIQSEIVEKVFTRLENKFTNGNPTKCRLTLRSPILLLIPPILISILKNNF